jgi:GT2 family glycosyltransferase
MKYAQAPYILSLDDDSRLCDSAGISRALHILGVDSKVGAVMFSQIKENGELWPPFMQAAPVRHDCITAAFVTFGCILRRELFLELGGFREIFWMFGEEGDYCKRMLDKGFHVVYLPEAGVIHDHNPAGRNELMRLRLGCRNKCFDALFNEPFPMVLFSIPWRLLAYLCWRKVPCEHYSLDDSGGVRWILRELVKNLPEIWSNRRPLKWRTYRRWLEIKKQCPPY